MEDTLPNQNSKDGKCGHFTMRGFVSGIRKKDGKKCYPFTRDGISLGSEERVSELSPSHIPIFKWYDCPKCLWTGFLEESGNIANHSCKVLESIVPVHVRATVASNRNATRELSDSRKNLSERKDESVAPAHENTAVSSHEDAPMQLCDSGQASQENLSGERQDESGVPGNEDANISSHGDEMIWVSNSRQECKEFPSEERKDDTCDIINLDGDENGKKPVCDGVLETRDESTLPVREEVYPSGGHDYGEEENAQHRIPENAIKNPCLIEAIINGFDKATISSNGDKHGYGKSVCETGASSKPGSSEENALEKVNVGKTDPPSKPGSFAGKARGKVIVVENDEELSENDESIKSSHDNSVETLHRKKTRKVRTLEDILKSDTPVVCAKGPGASKDSKTEYKAETSKSKEAKKAILAIDLNCLPDNTVALQGNSEKASAGEKAIASEKASVSRKRKRKTIQERDEAPLQRIVEMFSSNKKTDLARVENGRSAFVPWKEGSGIQFASDDVQNTVPWALRRCSMDQFEIGSSQYYQPEASSGIRSYMNSTTERPTRVEAKGTFNPTATDEMEVVALLAKNQHERRSSYTEGIVGNSSNSHAPKPSKGFSAFPLTQPCYMPSETNHLQGLSSGSSYLTRPLELFPSRLFTREENENNYRQKEPVQTLDLFVNDNIIPATHLLRLMDAGLSTSTSANMEKRQNFTETLVLHDRHFPQLSSLESGQSMNRDAPMCSPPYTFFNQVPGLQSLSCSSQGIDNFRNGLGTSKLMSDTLKTLAKDKTVSKKVPEVSRSLRSDNSGDRIQIGEPFLSASAPTVFRTHMPLIDSTRDVELNVNADDQVCKCPVNRNPADFSVPEPGNEYTIGFRDLKRKHKFFSQVLIILVSEQMITGKQMAQKKIEALEERMEMVQGEWQHELDSVRVRLQKLLEIENRFEGVERALEYLTGKVEMLLKRDGAGSSSATMEKHKPPNPVETTSAVEEALHPGNIDCSMEREPREDSRGLRRLEFPIFMGEDPHGWIFKAERYFAMTQMTEKEKMEAFAVSMEGRALG